jgi:hypothetical protein
VAESNPIELLVAYAMDLLSQTEAQHRCICRTQAHLQSVQTQAARKLCFPQTFPAAQQKKALATVAAEVDTLLDVIACQQGLLVEMQRTLALALLTDRTGP